MGTYSFVDYDSFVLMCTIAIGVANVVLSPLCVIFALAGVMALEVVAGSILYMSIYLGIVLVIVCFRRKKLIPLWKRWCMKFSVWLGFRWLRQIAGRTINAVKNHQMKTYKVALVFLVAGFALLAVKRRVRRAIVAHLSTHREEAKKNSREFKKSCVDTILNVLSGITLVVGAAGVVLDKRVSKRITTLLKDISTVRFAATAGASFSSMLVQGLTFVMEAFGVTWMFPSLEEKLYKLSEGAKSIDELIDPLEFGADNLKVVAGIVESESTEKQKKKLIQATMKSAKKRAAKAAQKKNKLKKMRLRSGKEKVTSDSDSEADASDSDDEATLLDAGDESFLTKRQFIIWTARIVVFMGLAYGAYYLYHTKWSKDKLKKQKKVRFVKSKATRRARREAKEASKEDSEEEPIEDPTPEARVKTETFLGEFGSTVTQTTDMDADEFRAQLRAHNELIMQQQEQFNLILGQLVEPEGKDYVPRQRHQNQHKKKGKRERKLKLRRKLTPEEYEEWQKRKHEAYSRIVRVDGEPRDWGDDAEYQERAAKGAWKSWWADHDKSDFYIENVDDDWNDRIRVSGRTRFESHDKRREPSMWEKFVCATAAAVTANVVIGALTSPEAKQTVAKVREAPKATPKKKEKKEPAPAIKKSLKGKEKEAEPCPRKGCVGNYFHPVTGKKEVCRFQHARKESLVPGSPVLPKSVARSKHAILSKKGSDGSWFKNANAVCCGSRMVTSHHAHDPGVAADLENDAGAHALVQFKQYRNIDLATCPKPPGFGASYKMAVPKIGEEVWVVGYDCDSNTTWHESVGAVEELQAPYLSIEGALCHTASTHPTLSGSAVINRQGQLVGWHQAGNDVSAPRNCFIAVTSQMIVDFGSTGSSATH